MKQRVIGRLGMPPPEKMRGVRASQIFIDGKNITIGGSNFRGVVGVDFAMDDARKNEAHDWFCALTKNNARSIADAIRRAGVHALAVQLKHDPMYRPSRTWVQARSWVVRGHERIDSATALVARCAVLPDPPNRQFAVSIEMPHLSPKRWKCMLRRLRVALSDPRVREPAEALARMGGTTAQIHELVGRTLTEVT